MVHLWPLETRLFLVDQFLHRARLPRSCAQTHGKKSIDDSVLQGLVIVGSDKVALHLLVNDKISLVELDVLSPAKRCGILKLGQICMPRRV